MQQYEINEQVVNAVFFDSIIQSYKLMEMLLPSTYVFQIFPVSYLYLNQA